MKIKKIIPVLKITLAVSILAVGTIFFINKSSEVNGISADDDIVLTVTDPDTSRDAEGDTFSIVAYDKTTGQVGGAGCSCVSISGGIDFLSDLITDGTTNSTNIVGAIHSQASYNSTTQGWARDRMLAGDTPQQIINFVVANDGGSASRQYGVVGVDVPGAAGWTGSSNGNFANDIQVDNSLFTISVQGNILDTSNGPDILNDIRDAFLNTDGTLGDRLMAALQGAKRVGGDNRCQSRGNSGRTAFVQVLSPGETSPSLFFTTGNAVADGIEPIDVLQCQYDASIAPPTCRGTVNTFPYFMDFEDQVWIKDESNCGPEASTNSWIRSRFSTPTANTGPSGASQGNLYMFVEADQGTNDRAIITSPCLDIPPSETTVITFDYHMFGATMGALSLTVNSGSGWSTLWTRSGAQGNSWNIQEEIDLSAYAGSTIRLRFDATTGAGTTSDMAIDNIRIGNPPPPPPPVSCTNTVDVFDYAEGFEGDIGLWVQASGDAGDWIRFSGSTPSGNTGPSSASQGSEYLYIEASSNGTTGEIGANATAILESPCFDLTYAQGADFTFDYHSWGANAGTISLQASEFEGVWSEIFNVSGVNNNAWVPATVSLDAYKGKIVKLRFVGTTGNGFASDLAIDNTALTLNCPASSEYSGGSWIGGAPTIGNAVTITDNYTTASDGGSLDACELTISSGATLRISQGDYLRVNGDITVNGTLIIEHQGVVVQDDPDASVINNGNINVELSTPPLKQRDFMIMGSPMTAETRTGVFNNAYNVQEYTPANFVPFPGILPGGTNFADDNFDDWNPANGSVVPGDGYLVFPQASYNDPAYNGPPPVSTLVFDMNYTQGTLNNGTVTRPITFNGLGTNPDGTPNVLANPYASPIDASTLIANNPLINEVYFWEHLTEPSAAIPGANTINVSMDDISMFNGTMGVPAANDPGTSTTPNGVISTGQGFGIKAFGAGSVSFTNSMRLTSGNTTLRTPEGLEKLVLKVRSEQYGIGGYAGIGFRAEGTPQLDENMDSNRLATLVSLYSHLDDGSEQLGIQTRESFDAAIKIPMGFESQVEAETTYTISIADAEGLILPNIQIYLIDNQENIITDLTQTNYEFRSNKGTFNGRFTLQFEQDGSLGSSEYKINNITVYPNPTDNVINIYSPDTYLKSIEVYDVRGRSLTKVVDGKQNSVTLDVTELETGIYFVKINTEAGEVTKKIIKR